MGFIVQNNIFLFHNWNKDLALPILISKNLDEDPGRIWLGVLISEQIPWRGPYFGTSISENSMDVTKILEELRQEREQLEEAILSLERLASGRGRRRGRPPAWMTELKRRGRPPGSKNKAKESTAA